MENKVQQPALQVLKAFLIKDSAKSGSCANSENCDRDSAIGAQKSHPDAEMLSGDADREIYKYSRFGDRYFPQFARLAINYFCPPDYAQNRAPNRNTTSGAVGYIPEPPARLPFPHVPLPKSRYK